MYRTILISLTIFTSGVYSSEILPADSYTDHQCSCSRDDYWLDVVIVTDNSVGMTQTGLFQVIASFTSLFTSSRFSSANITDPRNIRVGIVTYNKDYKIEADLNKFNSSEEMMNYAFANIQISNRDESLVMYGLTGAEAVLDAGRKNNFRANYQQVVILYASAYRGTGREDPLPTAERLKANGVTIITVAFEQNGDEAEVVKIGELASPNNNFVNLDLNLDGEIHNALCQANCYCPNLWTQYTSDFNSTKAMKYGVCLQVSGLPASWASAKISCQSMISGGHLATEFDSKKHSFNQQLFEANKIQLRPFMYHIGLKYMDGKYKWDQGSDNKMIPLGNYTSWNKGYPEKTTTKLCVLNEETGSSNNVGWQNEDCYRLSKNYICEVNACDTSNYCA